MKEVSWGIIGCGDVTEVKSGPALQKTPRSSLVAVMRRNGARAEDYAKRHTVERWYDDGDALIADPKVNAVYVATPPSSHREWTVKALKAGKAVFCEKPMAMSADECAAMVDAAKSAGQSLCIAYYRRALPRFERFRELATGGTIGTPIGVSVRQCLRTEDHPGEVWKLDPAVNGGGFFADMHVHVLDWLTYVFGPVRILTSDVRPHATLAGVESEVVYSLGFDDVPLSGFCSYFAGAPLDEVTVYGTKGSVAMGFFDMGPIRLVRGTDAEEIVVENPPHVHGPLIERFVGHLLDGSPNPCPGEAGSQATDICMRILGR